jgi:spore germination protein
MPVHVVQSGDSLWQIAGRYGVSLETIVNVNGLQAEGFLVPGLALYIPTTELPIRYYEVRPGDTLFAIARRFQTSPERILAANPNIKENLLYAGQRLRVPSPVKLKAATLGFIVPYNPESILDSFSKAAVHLTYAAIVAYTFTEKGELKIELDDTAVLKRSKEQNVSPLLCIRNYENERFSPKLADNVLGTPSLRSQLAKAIAAAVKEKGYSGVSIDFEFIPPLRRKAFIVFLRNLKEALGEAILHVNVHSKTADIPSNPIIGAYDYKEIGRIADITAVMTMDYGYPTGPPNPISPVNWMEEVIRYAAGLIPPNKLQVAFPLYGYDWEIPYQPSRLAKSRSVLSAQNKAVASGAVIQYDAVFRAPSYVYREKESQHLVWFEDIRSYMAKYELVDLYGLLGVTFWQLAFPFPQNWAYMEKAIAVR